MRDGAPPAGEATFRASPEPPTAPRDVRDETAPPVETLHVAEARPDSLGYVPESASDEAYVLERSATREALARPVMRLARLANAWMHQREGDAASHRRNDTEGSCEELSSAEQQ